MTGNAINCPHCKVETILFNPSNSKPPKIKEEEKEENLIEDRLETVGSSFYALWVCAAIICVLVAFLMEAQSNMAGVGIALLSAIAAYVQGIIIRIIFHAVAEIIRLLRNIRQNTAR